MSQHCRANPCCGDVPCRGVPVPQHASGYPSFNPPASTDLREENERLNAAPKCAIPTAQIVEEARELLRELDLWSGPEYDDDVEVAVQQAASMIRALLSRYDAADREAGEYEDLETEIATLKERLERVECTIKASGEIGKLIGFLEGNEVLTAAFHEACGTELLDRARAALSREGK